MSQLHNQQAELVSALVDPELPVPTDIQLPNGQPANSRFNVYRNNVVVGLTEVLSAAFPVVEKLVGEEFFQAMVGVYLRENPPTTPILFKFGESFPDFIRSFPPAGSVPYLADIAILEQARRTAFHSEDGKSVDGSHLAGVPEAQLPDLRMKVHPSVQIVRSPFPVYSIWHDNSDQPELSSQQSDRQTIDLESGEDVLVVRPSLNVTVHPLPAGCARFMIALATGATLQEAAGAASADADATGQSFDLAEALSIMIASGSISSLSRTETRP